MKRFHVHIHVDDLARNIAFYSKMFGAEPARVESDYAKWMLDEPAVNFARSDKHWVVDPQGLPWEHFRTLGSIPTFNDQAPVASVPAPAATPQANACCAPASPNRSSACC